MPTWVEAERECQARLDAGDERWRVALVEARMAERAWRRGMLWLAVAAIGSMLTLLTALVAVAARCAA